MPDDSRLIDYSDEYMNAEKTVVVCGSCKRASCVMGYMRCRDSVSSPKIFASVAELYAGKREDPYFWR